MARKMTQIPVEEKRWFQPEKLGERTGSNFFDFPL